MALNITIDKPKGIQIGEKGRGATGEVIALDTRLFMQLLAFGNCQDTVPLIETLKAHNVPGVLYEDVNDPFGVALLTYSTDTAFFVETVRRLLREPAFQSLTLKPDYTMMGRTYSIGYERDLTDTLIKRPIRHACAPAWPWAVWYPLRRKGAFEQLSAEEQRKLLMEHGGIGMAYGKADHGHDIRLACHGLDRNDNEFVVALVGKALAPLSKIVQHMRKTKQTAEFMAQMGPFFVGRAVWQNAVYPTSEEA